MLGQQITRVKNRLHAVLARHLVEPPVQELFCEKGRAFLRRAPVPEDEKLQIELDLQILETLEAAPAGVRFVFQGVRDGGRAGKPQGQIPWRLGILEQSL